MAKHQPEGVLDYVTTYTLCASQGSENTWNLEIPKLGFQSNSYIVVYTWQFASAGMDA